MASKSGQSEALRTHRKERHELAASLGYIVRLFLQKVGLLFLLLRNKEVSGTQQPSVALRL